MTDNHSHEILQRPLVLPCGTIFKNRIAKSPMSDSLGNGKGDATNQQACLYKRWAEGGTAVSVIGEVQGDACYPENTGNIVLSEKMNYETMQSLISLATTNDTHFWAQLGHAGALSHRPISQPLGPSALNLEKLQCDGMLNDDISLLPKLYAKTALKAKSLGFTGVQVHAGHGFLLSQFLSPLFNHRTDNYGGSIEARCRIIIEIIDEIRRSVGSAYPIGIRINSSDQIEGGLTKLEALEVVRLLDTTSVDIIDISGGTYFPGAKASSEGSTNGPYFLDFARQAKAVTNIPLMLTGGFKYRSQAINAIASGVTDMIGLARAMVLEPNLVNLWLSEVGGDPVFPKFDDNIPGGVTAWYTMRIAALGNNNENDFNLDLPSAIKMYEDRDAMRCIKWRENFSS